MTVGGMHSLNQCVVRLGSGMHAPPFVRFPQGEQGNAMTGSLHLS